MKRTVLLPEGRALTLFIDGLSQYGSGAELHMRLSNYYEIPRNGVFKPRGGANGDDMVEAGFSTAGQLYRQCTDAGAEYEDLIIVEGFSSDKHDRPWYSPTKNLEFTQVS